MLTISIGLAVLAAFVVFLVSRQRRAGNPEVLEKQSRPFAAVELIASMESCVDARQLAGRRLLAARAPALPLHGCLERCRCSYELYDDRRHENRRRSDDGLPDDFIYAAEEKRDRADRRSS